jgi:hypothetical protein
VKNLIIISLLLIVGLNGFGQDAKDYTGKWNLIPLNHDKVDQVWDFNNDSSVTIYLRGRDDIPSDSLLLKYEGTWSYSSTKITITLNFQYIKGKKLGVSKYERTKHYYFIKKDKRTILKHRANNNSFNKWWFEPRL